MERRKSSYYKRLRAATFSGMMCSKCLRIYYGKGSHEYTRVDKNCEVCGAKGPRELVPNIGAQALLDEVFAHAGHGFLPVILFIMIIETLLDEFLIDWLVKEGTSLDVAAVLLGQNRGLGRKIELFKTLTGTSLGDEIATTGFYNDMRKLQKKRNKFLHDIKYDISEAISEADVEKALKRTTGIFPVFFDLHNKFIAKESLK